MAITSAHAVAAAALTAWAGLLAGLGGSPAVWTASLALIAAAAAFGAWLARRALPADGAQLTWDGASWALTTRASSGGAPAGTPGAVAQVPIMQVPIKQVVTALDLGAWILLRLQSEAGGARWQVVRAGCAGPAWHGLRLALRTQAGPVGPRPARSAADRQDL